MASVTSSAAMTILFGYSMNLLPRRSSGIDSNWEFLLRRFTRGAVDHLVA